MNLMSAVAKLMEEGLNLVMLQQRRLPGGGLPNNVDRESDSQTFNYQHIYSRIKNDEREVADQRGHR